MGLSKRSMGPRPINDVEPENSQNDMAREQLGPLGVPGSPAPGAHGPASRRTRLQSDLDIAKKRLVIPGLIADDMSVASSAHRWLFIVSDM